MDSPRRTDLLLLAGMMAGVAIAGFGLLGAGPGPSRELPDDVVAIVDGETISRTTFETAVGLVERDRAGSVSADERTQILERLIDEELLLQRGLALGLPRSDRRLRVELVAAVIEAATASAGDAEPTPAQLRGFFDENRALFHAPASVRVAQVFVAAPPRSDDEAATRANQAFERLRAGEDVVAVRGELGDPPAVEIPSSPQPIRKLRDYVGAAAAAVAQGLKTGEASSPQRGADGYRVLVMLERSDTADVAADAAFEEQRSAVLEDYQRRAAERALRDYMRDLRAQSEVTLAEPTAEQSR